MRSFRRAGPSTPAFLLVLAVSPAAEAQQAMSLDSLLRAHRTPLELVDGRVRGSGLEVLIRAAAEAQFVMVGESHNLRDIPILTGDLFQALHDRYGFEYLALEDGPYAVQMYMEKGVRGNEAASFDLANRYVNALQFWTDQEVELIIDVGSISGAALQPVWGVDNAWGALHLLEALGERAPSSSARRTVEDLAASARKYESFRPEGESQRERFLTDVLTEEDLASLETEFRDARSEAQRLLSILRIGYETYARRRGAGSLYAANDAREQLMRRQFMEHYRRAEAADGEPPRVVLKFGQWHALAGPLNWGFVQPLGTFLSEFAASRGMEYLGVWTGLVNEPGLVWSLTDFPDYLPLARAGSTDRWWLVDLRPVRQYVAADLVADVSEELRRIIFGFEFALLIGSGERATRERLHEGQPGNPEDPEEENR